MIEQWKHNFLLEMIRKAEKRVFHAYPEIEEEVDSMVANLLNLESLKMRDELKEAEKQKKEAVAQATKEATERASLTIIEMMKQFGFTPTDEQIQEMLNRAMEKQELEE